MPANIPGHHAPTLVVQSTPEMRFVLTMSVVPSLTLQKANAPQVITMPARPTTPLHRSEP